jgi:hypothetical protein
MFVPNGDQRMNTWTGCVAGCLLVAAAVTVGGTVAAAGKIEPGKPDTQALARTIDQAVNQKIAAEKTTPAARADDAEFLRRAYLDITGVIPTADRAAAFLDSPDLQKRAKLIDELLASPQYGRHMADIWQRFMLPRESSNRRLQGAPLVKWLEESFNANKPWHQMVRELLTATGAQNENGAVTYFLANPSADKITDSVSKLFLGVQLQCAQCHNHPFTKWKQDEYWAMAAFFMKVRPDNVNRAARQGNSPGISESGRGRAARLPESARTVPARFLGGEQPKLNTSEPYRPVLAEWITSAKNPYFARAIVNRTWGQFFGRGFVNPIDDMHEGNAPSHPELLQKLADGFVADGFDLKHLIRAICTSEAYGRTSKAAAGGEPDSRLFARMAIKPMTPEQLYDSLTAVLGSQGNDRPAKGKAAQVKRAGIGAREQFILFFEADEGASATEYHAGIPQVLRLMNSPQMNNTAAVVNAVARGASPAGVIERLYLTTLSRRPRSEETTRLTAYVQKQGDARQAYGDILWALLNSSEFTLNH